MKKIKKFLTAGVAVCLSVGLLGITACQTANPNDDNNGGAKKYYSETTVGANGTVSGYPNKDGKFSPDYDSWEETLQKNRELNVELAKEGIVLLKNEKNALPLSEQETKVTLFGYYSAHMRTGGGGSGSGRPGIYGIEQSTLKSSLEDNGFTVNPTLYDFYNATNNDKIGVTGITSQMKESYANYGDAAILVFARSGSEGSDLQRSNVYGHSNSEDHYLMLEDNEIAMIKHAKANFDKVIVLLNSANVMQINQLAQEKTATNLGVDAVLQVGHVGNDGAAAIAPILNGTVNPSGHTVDTWAVDFKKDPTWNNFGDNSQAGGSTQMYSYNGVAKSRWHSMEYREDIYVGYRYYETKYTELEKDAQGSGDAWYNQNVLYPFGYGLSYTTFEWELAEDIKTGDTITAANQTVTTKIKVTNTGSVAGKDVVQVYAQTPYTAGEIEKASSVLMGFTKTKLLQPGESEVVTVQFVAQDMASFDWDDANSNGFVGYELEAGDYIISARPDVHSKGIDITRTIEEDITCPTDYTTGKEITAVFSQTDGIWADYYSAKDSLLNNLMTRDSDMAQPVTTTQEERTISRAEESAIEDRRVDHIYEDDEYDMWYVSSVPNTWTQGKNANQRVNGKAQISLADMAGIPFTAPTLDENGVVTLATDEDSQKWEEFLNQLTWEELQSLARNGNYGRPAIGVIDMMQQTDWDGPSQIGGLNGDPNRIGTCWISPVIMSSTWNTELVNKFGKAMGSECLYLDIAGWYGPGMNIHRSPFGGRNFEYYSEDGVLSGKIAAAICDGSASKGVIAYCKHIALNDQETNRDADRGLFTYATEQAIREIYLKPFELAIKEGHTLGTMNCANRIGTWVGYSQGALQTGILRREWDFMGITLTDAGGGGMDYSKPNSLWRNGTSLPLGVGNPEETVFKDNMVYGKAEGSGEFNLASPTQWYWCRLSVMYNMYAAANSLGIHNGLIGDTGMRVSLKVGTAYDTCIFTKAVYGTNEVKGVTITSGSLPEGVTLSEDGVLKGTPQTAGTWGVIVTCRGDGWVQSTVKIRVVVTE